MPPDTSLLPFLTAAKQQGASDQFLVNLLVENGWAEKKIYAAFRSYYETATGETLPARITRAESARDAFFYLLAFGTLATWSGSLGWLLFTLIDQEFPDPVAYQASYRNSYSFANNMAGIIVAFPLYLWINRIILKSVALHPEKLDLGVRKWLTYIALLIAAAFLVGDLVTFLTYFLRGELTTRFVAKVIVILIIAGGIFSYYLASLKESNHEA